MPKCGTKLDMSLNLPMKKVTQSLLALLLAALPVTGFAAAADVLFSQKNSSNTAWANVIVAPTASSALAFNSSKVPISTQALTLSSVTSPAGIDLTLAGGSSGASLVLGQGANGAVTITPAGTGDINLTAAGSGSFVYVNAANPILFINETDQSADARLWAMQSEGGLFKLRAFNDALSSAVDTFAATRTGNLLIGTTSETGLTGSGGLKINSSTAGSASAGALVVTGGLATGADSYIGGKLTQSVSIGTIVQSLVHTNLTSGFYQEWKTNTTTDRAYIGTGNQVIASGSIADFAINSVTGNVILGTGGAARLTIGSAGATFAGAVTVSVANPEVSIRSASDAAAQRQYLTFGSPNYNRAQFQSVSAGTNDGSLELRVFNAGTQTLTQTWNKDGSSTFAGAVTVGGKIQSSVSTATGYNQLFDTTGITTGRGAFGITSTGAGLAFGIEASVGGTSFTGSTAYASYFGTTTATPIHFVTNSVIRQTIDSTGAATFAGAVKMSAYNAGAATFDSAGNITSVSDARLKNITGTFTKGLAEIVKLTPKLYTWKPETGLVTDDINATLIAQDLIAAGIPEAVTTYRTVPVMEDDVQSAEDIAAGKPATQHAKLDADGKAVTQRVDANYSVSDRTVIAALVNAVKELKAEIDALKAAK